MTDPAQQVAARAAVRVAAEELGCAVGDLVVRQVVRRRRRDTKVPFYAVAVEQAGTGTTRKYQVSDDGGRVERDPPGSCADVGRGEGQQ